MKLLFTRTLLKSEANNREVQMYLFLSNIAMLLLRFNFVSLDEYTDIYLLNRFTVLRKTHTLLSFSFSLSLRFSFQSNEKDYRELFIRF